MAVNITETVGGSGTTHSQRSDKSAQTNVFADSDVTVVVPRFVYSKLSNITDMKTVTVEELSEMQNEYEAFMMAMESYAETGIDVDNISALDEYLGSLGLDIQYPFTKDSYGLSSFIGIEAEDFNRRVVTEVDGIVYDVITNDEGVDKEVWHLTPN